MVQKSRVGTHDALAEKGWNPEGKQPDFYIFLRLYAEVTITPIVPPACLSCTS